MQAKVKQDYFLPSLIAFSGIEFIKKEWRAVPVGAEDEAKSHPSLDVREDGDVDEPFMPLDVVDTEAPETDEGGVVEAVKKILPRRRSRKQVEEDAE